MTEQHESDVWAGFCRLNQRRRAIRDFDGSAVADDDVRAVLEQALLAPSSGNLQPYELHWVRDPATRLQVADACEAQRAARSASTLIVVVTSRAIGERTAGEQLRYVEHAAELDAEAKRYHRGQLAKFRRFLWIAPLAPLALLRWLLSLVDPVHSLLPLGPGGMRHWTARSGIYAAQTLLLAAAARGLDSCPMEGFKPRRVARALKLPRGSVIPIVIALGRRRDDARLDPRWRRSFGTSVVVV